MKKAVSTAMALSMMVGLMGVNASAYEAGSYDPGLPGRCSSYVGRADRSITGCLYDQRQRFTVSGDRSQICSEQCTDPDHGRCTGRS